MFENFKNMASMMGQAKQIGAKMEQFKEELGTIIVEGEAGARAVRVRVNGRMEVLGVKLDRVMLMTLATPPSQASETSDTSETGDSAEVPSSDDNGASPDASADKGELMASDDDLQMIEDLIAAAMNQALTKAKKAVQEKLSEVTGGLNIPGLDGLI